MKFDGEVVILYLCNSFIIIWIDALMDFTH